MELRGCSLFFSIGAVHPISCQQGAVLNEESLSMVTFCPFRLMGLLQSCLEEEEERHRIEGEIENKSGGGGYCIAQHNRT